MTEKALEFARKARKLAPPELYDVVRNLEKAIEELISALNDKKGGSKDKKIR